MASRYWVGGTGNWSDDDNHWATETGGDPGDGNLPTSSDNVYFDANSGAGTCTIDVVAAYCLDFDASVSSITTFAGGTSLNVYGDFTVGAGITWSNDGTLFFYGSSKNITTNSVTINCVIVYLEAGSSYTLQDNFTGGSLTTFLLYSTSSTGATFTTNNNDVSVGYDFGVSGSYSSTHTLNSGSSTITCRGLRFSSSYGSVVLNTNSTDFICNNPSSSSSLGSVTVNNLTINSSSKTSEFAISGSPTISGTFTCTGDSATNRVLIKSNTLGTARTITAANVSLTNVDFQDITGAGAATWSGTSVGDCLGNTNITFDASDELYWVDTDGGSWSATTSWSTSSGGESGARIPLPQDNVHIDANSITSGSSTITTDMPRLGANIDFTGVLNSPSFNFDSVNRIIFGSLTLSSAMSFAQSNYSVLFYGRGDHTLTTNGLTITIPLQFYMLGGTVTLSDNLSSSSSLTFANGTFDANDKNVTCSGIYSNSGVGEILMGSGTWTLSGTGTVWNLISAGSLTITPETSTIVISNTSSTSKTFGGVNKTYNNITFSGDNITVTGSNTFNSFNVNNAGLTNGLKLTSGTTQTVSDFTTNGSSGSLAMLLSTTGGSAATLSKSSGTINVRYMSIQDSTATGGATWIARDSTDVSGNSGWIFTVTPKTLAASNVG